MLLEPLRRSVCAGCEGCWQGAPFATAVNCLNHILLLMTDVILSAENSTLFLLDVLW